MYSEQRYIIKKRREISISSNDKSELLGDICFVVRNFLFSIDLLLLYTSIKLSEMERKPPTPAESRGKRRPGTDINIQV